MFPFPPHSPVVGVATHPDILLDPNLGQECDIIELRVDLYPSQCWLPDSLTLPPDIPLIVTCRSPEEGGAGPLEAYRREEILLPWLDAASAIDIELGSAHLMPRLLAGARSSATALIGSFHDFQETPPEGFLHAQIASATSLALDLVKLATFAHHGRDLLSLASIMIDPPSGSPPLALMAMGPLAPLSRTLLGSLGSALNYGYLGQQPNAPGQISARLLRDTLNLLDPRRQS